MFNTCVFCFPLFVYIITRCTYRVVVNIISDIYRKLYRHNDNAECVTMSASGDNLCKTFMFYRRRNSARIPLLFEPNNLSMSNCKPILLLSMNSVTKFGYMLTLKFAT